MNDNPRSADPPVSAPAGGEVSRQQQAMCFHAVTRLPGLTAREIEDELGIKAHKRLPQLRRAKLIRNGPVRICSISKRPARTWLPAPFTQPPTPFTGA